MLSNTEIDGEHFSKYMATTGSQRSRDIFFLSYNFYQISTHRRKDFSCKNLLADSPTAESGSRRLADLLSRWVDDSPTRRIGESTTRRLAESVSRWLPDSPNRGVVDSPTWQVGELFFDYVHISRRIRGQIRNGSKGSVRDSWGIDFCKNPRKSASLPCPFNRTTSLPIPLVFYLVWKPLNLNAGMNKIRNHEEWGWGGSVIFLNS